MTVNRWWHHFRHELIGTPTWDCLRCREKYRDIQRCPHCDNGFTFYEPLDMQIHAACIARERISARINDESPPAQGRGVGSSG